MIRYAAFAALLFTACKSKPPVNVAAMVNNRAITYEELDKNFQSRFEPAAERSSEDQVMIQKLEILRGLIDNEIMLQKAEKLGLMAVDAGTTASAKQPEAVVQPGEDLFYGQHVEPCRSQLDGQR